jgi:RND family efflux transporter MFP subunit
LRLIFKLLLPVMLIGLSLAAAGYLRATRPEVEPSPEIEQVWTVRTEPVLHQDHQPVLRLFGEVVAGREVVLRALVAGEVIETAPALVEGGRFAAGEVMLEIDPFTYETALQMLAAEEREAAARKAELAADLEADRALVELDREQETIARRDLERFERLMDRETTSEKALDDARANLVRQRAALRQRQQAIAMTEARIAQQEAALERLAVSRRRAERDLANTGLKAPFAGMVTEIGAQPGKMVGSNDPIARLIDEDRLEIAFQLGDDAFGRLWESGLIGRAIAARWRLGRTEFAIEARVARVVATIDATSGGVTVHAEITANPAAAPLRPGAFVEVELPDREYQDAVELPASALFGEDRVYVVEDGRLEARTVRLLSTAGERILVAGELDDGAEVVTSRLAEIAPGLKVEVVE